MFNIEKKKKNKDYQHKGRNLKKKTRLNLVNFYNFIGKLLSNFFHT